MSSLPQFKADRTCQACSLHNQVGTDRYGRQFQVPKSVGMSTIWWPQSLSPAPTTPAVLVLGQNPGYNEDQQDEPFVGESGQLVRKVFLPGAHIHELASVYITNAVRCFTVGNVEPTASQCKACAPHTLADLEAISSYHEQVYLLCLGAVASSSFLKHVVGQKGSVKQAEAFRLNGKYVEYAPGHQVRFYATMHPAAALRQRHYAHVIKDHIAMLSEALQGNAPQVTHPHFIVPRDPHV